MSLFTRLTTRYLKANKTRTIVTIIGIILSAAMITAVTTSIFSLQRYMVDLVSSDTGSWHGAAYNVDGKRVSELSHEEQIDSITYMQNIGYARLDGYSNDYKPYLFIGGISEDFTELLPVRILEGRMPESRNEIILPRHLATNGGIYFDTGDTIDVDMGIRTFNGEKLWQASGYHHENDGAPEQFTAYSTESFKVVGFYERPSFENYSAPGYTALTVGRETPYGGDVYFELKKPDMIYDFMDSNFTGVGSSTNRDLLMYSGISNDDNFMDVLYGLGAILICLIVFGSISLIYNAFFISVSERTRQFGLLSSVGATSRQLRNSVLSEAMMLSVIGIPLGVLSGICGMAVTFAITDNLFEMFVNTADVSLKLRISPLSIVIAALIGLVTVLISAYIPVIRALRVPTIDAIRQTREIRIKPRKVRTSKLFYRIFGFEAMLARKSFKRSSGKYRATVVSLFLSIVLFISASSFYTYLTASSDYVIGKPDYDIVVNYNRELASKADMLQLYEKLAGLEGVENSTYMKNTMGFTDMPQSVLSRDFLEYRYPGHEGDISFGTMLVFVSDDTYFKLLDSEGFDDDAFKYPSNPAALALDFNKIYNHEDGKYHTFNVLSVDELDIGLKVQKHIEGYFIDDSYQLEDGSLVYIYMNNEGDRIEIPEKDFYNDVSVRIGGRLDGPPFFLEGMSGGMALLYPYSSMDSILGSDEAVAGGTLVFKAENHRELFDRIHTFMYENNLPVDTVYDIASSQESSRALVKVIRIFSYGFIILISLIATANVFNTISTNVQLRRREFAVLRSVGLTVKGLNRIMNFECLLYGFKSLIYGLPVAIGLSYLIYRAISHGWQTGFIFPTPAVIIASLSVFIVVFLTMLYAMEKIKKANTVETLRNDNI